jgi:hypothetical protein
MPSWRDDDYGISFYTDPYVVNYRLEATDDMWAENHIVRSATMMMAPGLIDDVLPDHTYRYVTQIINFTSSGPGDDSCMKFALRQNFFNIHTLAVVISWYDRLKHDRSTLGIERVYDDSRKYPHYYTVEGAKNWNYHIEYDGESHGYVDWCCGVDMKARVVRVTKVWRGNVGR